MGQSIEARFNGNKSEGVQYAKDFGILQFMAHYEIKTYTSALDFLEKAEPGYAFPMVKNSDSDMLTEYKAAKSLLLAMLEELHHRKAEGARKDIQIARLQRELDYFKSTHRNESANIIQALLSECQGGQA